MDFLEQEALANLPSNGVIKDPSIKDGEKIRERRQKPDFLL
ncbi:hypothetical protein SSYIS1_23490 [Serratia symbiotica]|uniref:Uncharacterized protein n=1 Tax=Serratia symbiotica TaxID=138074 RepID=A0A455VHH7_9GAMM|nr:hypothetical protein SSYIS1_23490 [Serratia symbiotica]